MKDLPKAMIVVVILNLIVCVVCYVINSLLTENLAKEAKRIFWAELLVIMLLNGVPWLKSYWSRSKNYYRRAALSIPLWVALVVMNLELMNEVLMVCAFLFFVYSIGSVLSCSQREMDGLKEMLMDWIAGSTIIFCGVYFLVYKSIAEEIVILTGGA